MHRDQHARRATGHRQFHLFAIVALLAGLIAGLAPALPMSSVPTASAHHTDIRLPVPSGEQWYASQGYNTSPGQGGSHYNCDPSTLTDSPSHSTSCSQYWQYKYSFDLTPASGSATGKTVLAPVTGTIRWIDQAYGGMSIDLGDGYAVAFFHVELASSLAAGQSLTRGQYVGTVAAPGNRGNGGFAHIHIGLWRTTDGGNWSRTSEPFTGDHTFNGVNLPALAESSRNQYQGTTFTSSNDVSAASTTPPAVPTLSQPANGTTYWASSYVATLGWGAASGATDYQVWLNDGAIKSPWVTGTSWTTGSLAPGQYAWQVKSRNANGESALSAKWVFWVEGTSVPTPPTTPQPLGVTLEKSDGSPGLGIYATGGGMNASETVDLYWDQASGTPLVSVAANSAGNWSAAVSIPDATGGAHKIVAKGRASAKSANANFTIKSAVTRNPYQGPPGTPLSITVKGFGANETVALTFYITSSNPVSLGSVTTNANGSGTVSTQMPQAPFDWHDYKGTGQTSGLTAWGAFYVTSSATLSSTQGAAGSSLTINATGLSASDSVRVAWNQTNNTQGTTLCSGTTTSTGSYSCSFTVPQAASGAYPIVVTASQGPAASATFGISGAASVTLTPNGGKVGEPFQVSIGGFQAGETIAVTIDSATWQSATASAAGAAILNATVPFTTQGAHTIAARGTVSGKTASATLNVSPSMSISPNGGAGGTNVTAYVRGMKANQSVNVRFNATSGSSGTSVCSGTTDGNGSYSCSFTVPSVASGTTYNLYAASGSLGATATFTASATSGVINGGTVLGAGTYQITATQEGLVGGWTSNGHQITPNDHFVSLPGCTATNCDWLTPGSTSATLGYVTPCGDSCYVRVTNPATGSCRVEPIYDTGPWFTNDNWWEPTERRTLNNLPTTVNILGQGYTGSDAAKDGLNVGYGLSNGVGVSNKSYQVGNRAAIDLADGTWVDIGFPDGAGPMTVVVSMLWQTGESPSAAAAACLGSTQIGTPRISIAPTSGAPGSAVTVTGTNYTPGETVNITWDSSTGTLLAAVTADNNGGFTKAVTVPSNATLTTHLIVGSGQTSGAKPSRTFTVAAATPTPTPTSTSTPTGIASVLLSTLYGQAGSGVTVTGSGFVANETVNLYWDSTYTGDLLGTATADGSGGFTLAITIPTSTATGKHLIAGKGMQSGSKGSRSFTVLPKTAISISPVTGPSNTSVAVSAVGFVPGETVEIRWKTSTGTILASGPADANGAYSATIVIPSETAANYYIVGRGATSGFKATRTFTLSGTATPTSTATPTPTATATATPKPAIVISPLTGGVDSTVQVTGSGYRANEQIQVYWDSTGTTGTLLRTVTATSLGTFSTSITVPTAKGGNHLIVGKGVTSGVKPSRTFVVSQTAMLGSATGKPGDSVTVQVRGFQPGEPVTFYWDSATSTPLLSLTASSTGSGSGSITIPATVNGPHQVLAIGGATANDISMPFTVSGATMDAATLALDPNAGGGGGGITAAANGANFWSQESVQLFWNANTSPSTTGTTGPNGTVSLSLSIPTVAGGNYTVTLKGVASGRTATATYTVQPRIEFTPPIGEPGATIKVDVKGWTAGQTASIYWNRTASTNGTLLCSATARDSGTASCSFKVPSGFPAGTDVPVMAIGSPGSVSSTFRVTNSPVGFAPAQEASATPTVEATSTAEASPSAEATAETPAATPTEAVTEAPTEEVPTEAPTEAPTEIPTEIPTPEPTVVPEPRSVVAVAVSDVTVYSAKPNEQPSPDLVGQLTAGGPDGSAAYITFTVEGVAGAQVTNAQLVLTAAGPSGAGSLVGILYNYWVDEASAVYSTLPVDGISAAVDLNGNPAYLPPAGPGQEIRLDVTGSIAGDGTYTFVITGTPDALALLYSRESGVPARLELTVQ